MEISKTDNLGKDDFEPVDCGNPEELQNLIRSMSWKELSAVKVINGNEAMEGSGSYEDGFSLAYYEGDNQLITPSEPSFEDLCEILISFYSQNDEWKNNSAWSGPQPSSTPAAPSLLSFLVKGAVFFGIGYLVARLLNGGG